jgi:hypothetical protein
MAKERKPAKKNGPKKGPTKKKSPKVVKKAAKKASPKKTKSRLAPKKAGKKAPPGKAASKPMSFAIRKLTTLAANFEFTYTRNGITATLLNINGTVIKNPDDSGKIYAPTDKPFFVTAEAEQNQPGSDGSLQIKSIPKDKNIWDSAKSFDFSEGANGTISETDIKLP